MPCLSAYDWGRMVLEARLGLTTRWEVNTIPRLTRRPCLTRASYGTTPHTAPIYNASHSSCLTRRPRLTQRPHLTQCLFECPHLTQCQYSRLYLNAHTPSRPLCAPQVNAHFMTQSDACGLHTLGYHFLIPLADNAYGMARIADAL